MIVFIRNPAIRVSNKNAIKKLNLPDIIIDYNLNRIFYAHC